MCYSTRAEIIVRCQVSFIQTIRPKCLRVSHWLGVLLFADQNWIDGLSWNAIHYNKLLMFVHSLNLVRKSLLEDYGLPAKHVTVIGGGVNLGTLPELTGRPSNRQPTALFIGLEFYRKGGDLVLKAFAQAHAVVPDAQTPLRHKRRDSL